MKKSLDLLALFLILLVLSCGGNNGTAYSVTYDGNGNTGGVAPTDANEYTEGSSVTILGAGNLIRTDHTFTGWNTESDGSGTNYTIGATLVMGNSNVALYAKWTQNPTYTVSYDGNGNTGGANPTDPNNYEENDNVTVLGLGTLVKAGYEFNSWNTESDGSGTNYAIGATLVMGNSNVVLYAKWTQNPTYTVSYDGNGNTGGTNPTDPNNYEENDNVTVLGLGTLVKAGYEFNSWNTESDGSGTSYDEGDVFVIGAADVTLFAIWDKVYALRDTGPAGGLIFYINPNYIADGWRYMEAAPVANEWTNKQWGTSGTLVGGTGTAIGDGPNNTSLVVAAIIAGGGSLDRAAILCNDLSAGGYSDWFLPSQGELNEMYTELYLHSVGGFTNIGYWSSSEFSDLNSWRQTFNTGAQTNNAKTTGYYVRAVRRF